MILTLRFALLPNNWGFAGLPSTKTIRHFFNYSCQAFDRTSNKMGSLFFFGVASVTFRQRIAGSIIQDGRRLRSGRHAFCITYIIISLRKCMVYLWFILRRNRTIPKHYLSPHCVNARYIFGLFCYGMVQFPNTIFRLANQYVVYRYICIQYSISFA